MSPIDLSTAAVDPAADVLTMAREAYYGLAGRIVHAIEPYSEADPVALLANTLIAAGNLFGRGVYALVESTRHYANENAAFVGRTSKGRKGQSWSTPARIFESVDEQWAKGRIKTGLSSGEGLIHNVRDAREESQPIKEKGKIIDYQRVVVDEGEPDKRLLIFEPEMATVLRRMAGETNSLSSVIREAWDSGRLSTLTKNSPLKATGAHISIIAHITEEELITSLTETERANGFANRFLYFTVKRSKIIPESEPVPDEILVPLVQAMQAAVSWAQNPRRLVRDDAAKKVWAAVYGDLSEGEPGLIGAVLGRSEAHVLRLSLLYAALDRSPVIREEHLTAALAVWDFAEASARRIFGDRAGISTVDIILNALRKNGAMSRTDINSKLFKRHKSAAEIDAALTLLERDGKARRTMHETPGRSIEMWEAV